MRHKLSSKLQQICMNTNLVVAYAIESRRSKSRIQIDAAWTIKIPRGAVKHPYSPIKVRGCKSVFLQRIEWSDSEDLQPLNIFGPWNRQRTFALSHTESFTYSASMNYNPLRIACCTISAENAEKGRGWSQRCLKACPDKRLTQVFFATASRRLRSIARRSGRSWSPRFASSRVARPALFRRVYTHTCDMFHLHDVSRRRHVGCCGITRALRVQQLRHIINLLWLPNAIRGIHYLGEWSALPSPSHYLRKCTINSFDANRSRIIGRHFIATIDRSESVTEYVTTQVVQKVIMTSKWC